MKVESKNAETIIVYNWCANRLRNIAQKNVAINLQNGIMQIFIGETLEIKSLEETIILAKFVESCSTGRKDLTNH
jgi:hypothetical protein